MKKSLIALAVAGAMTAPIVAQADATLYGSLRAGIKSADDQKLNVEDESSRIGIKGDVDLGLESTKGLFVFEQAVSTESGAWGSGRLAYLGATGNWGTALIGRQYHPFYTMIESKTGIFNSAGNDFGEAFQFGNIAHKRESNTVAYATPNMNGLQAVAGIVMDGGSDNNPAEEDLDAYNIGVNYAANGLDAGISYGAANDSDNWEILGVAASYQIDAFTVAGKYVDGSIDAQNTDFSNWEIAGVYTMGATSFKARYGNAEIETTGAADLDGDQWGVEVEQKLGKRGRVYVGYTDFDTEGQAIASSIYSMVKGEAKTVAKDTLVLGYRLDF
ncbi:porin [Marinobacterium marinum]|uniref:Porin n=1 Tax=Marinobacterium marinum TaxID=2756129 RepID=A0A7W1WXI8_9GAMM|nr:porin [Marinobacterium marinum]MBA4502037.1 porin [Marinobacterium marinum]